MMKNETHTLTPTQHAAFAAPANAALDATVAAMLRSRKLSEIGLPTMWVATPACREIGVGYDGWTVIVDTVRTATYADTHELFSQSSTLHRRLRSVAALLAADELEAAELLAAVTAQPEALMLKLVVGSGRDVEFVSLRTIVVGLRRGLPQGQVAAAAGVGRKTVAAFEADFEIAERLSDREVDVAVEFVREGMSVSDLQETLEVSRGKAQRLMVKARGVLVELGEIVEGVIS